MSILAYIPVRWTPSFATCWMSSHGMRHHTVMLSVRSLAKLTAPSMVTMFSQPLSVQKKHVSSNDWQPILIPLSPPHPSSCHADHRVGHRLRALRHQQVPCVLTHPQPPSQACCCVALCPHPLPLAQEARPLVHRRCHWNHPVRPSLTQTHCRPSQPQQPPIRHSAQNHHPSLQQGRPCRSLA